jgi:hypothetical protein
MGPEGRERPPDNESANPPNQQHLRQSANSTRPASGPIGGPVRLENAPPDPDLSYLITAWPNGHPGGVALVDEKVIGHVPGDEPGYGGCAYSQPPPGICVLFQPQTGQEDCPAQFRDGFASPVLAVFGEIPHRVVRAVPLARGDAPQQLTLMAKRREPVADALLGLRHGGVNDLADPLQRGVLRGCGFGKTIIETPDCRLGFLTFLDVRLLADEA